MNGRYYRSPLLFELDIAVGDTRRRVLSALRSSMPCSPPRIFLLSPARLDGKRAHLLFHPVTMFPVARALHSTAGATIGEIFTFLSGLYFRGKFAYAEAFARPPAGAKFGSVRDHA